MPQFILAAFIAFIGYCYHVGNAEPEPVELTKWEEFRLEQNERLAVDKDKSERMRLKALRLDLGLE